MVFIRSPIDVNFVTRLSGLLNIIKTRLNERLLDSNRLRHIASGQVHNHYTKPRYALNNYASTA
jgi:hypothetical protein